VPRSLFDKSAGRLPQDLEEVGAYWLVSDRTKSVFEAVDPAGFAFLACDVRPPSGDYDGPGYWLCDVVRVLDALDEARSRLKIGIREDKAYSDFGKKYYSLAGGRELVFRDDAIGDAHVFRMEYLQPVVICDQTLKDACKAGGLKGIEFDGAKSQFLPSNLETNNTR
jgi:Immunity protein family (Imm11)